MSWKALRFSVLLLSGLLSLADPPPDPKLFTLPAPSLRPMAAPNRIPPQTAAPALEDLNLTSESASTTDLAIQRAEALTGRAILTCPEPQDDPGGAYGLLKSTVFDPITNPEVIKIGKVHITGGVVGALKRKNPFYLLNPLIFAIDW